MSRAKRPVLWLKPSWYDLTNMPVWFRGNHLPNTTRLRRVLHQWRIMYQIMMIIDTTENINNKWAVLIRQVALDQIMPPKRLHIFTSKLRRQSFRPRSCLCFDWRFNARKRKVKHLRASQSLSETFHCTGYNTNYIRGTTLRGNRVACIGIRIKCTAQC